MHEDRTLVRVPTMSGREAVFEVRTGTSDHNSVWSCTAEDEYGLRGVSARMVVDVGAHIGGVTVCMAMDNPDARVIAVEALSANAELLQANVDRNGVSDRVTVLHRAASKPGKRTAMVAWNFKDGENGRHHRFISNVGLPANRRRQADNEEVDCIDLGALVEMSGGHIDVMKVDIEASEYAFLSSPAVKDVDLIVGEHHTGFQPLLQLLTATHDVALTGGTDDFGGFRATHR